MDRRSVWRMAVVAAVALAVFGGCAHRYYAEPLKPLGEAQQGEGKTVLDDGTVVFTRDRLEVRVRPMTVAELNRQFGSATEEGTNPYTFGNSVVFRTNDTPDRFAVFRVGVKNYQYPKVHLDPTRIFITTGNGRKYYALSFTQLWNYYRTYALGGRGGASASGGEILGDRRGNERATWLARTDLLKRSMYPDEMVFSGQEKDGYIVFEPLASDVSDVDIHIPDMAVRFDYKGEPVETMDVSARFVRQIGKVFPDGTRERM